MPLQGAFLLMKKASATPTFSILRRCQLPKRQSWIPIWAIFDVKLSHHITLFAYFLNEVCMIRDRSTFFSDKSAKFWKEKGNWITPQFQMTLFKILYRENQEECESTT